MEKKEKNIITIIRKDFNARTEEEEVKGDEKEGGS